MAAVAELVVAEPMVRSSLVRILAESVIVGALGNSIVTLREVMTLSVDQFCAPVGCNIGCILPREFRCNQE